MQVYEYWSRTLLYQRETELLLCLIFIFFQQLFRKQLYILPSTDHMPEEDGATAIQWTPTDRHQTSLPSALIIFLFIQGIYLESDKSTIVVFDHIIRVGLIFQSLHQRSSLLNPSSSVGLLSRTLNHQTVRHLGSLPSVLPAFAVQHFNITEKEWITAWFRSQSGCFKITGDQSSLKLSESVTTQTSKWFMELGRY